MERRFGIPVEGGIAPRTILLIGDESPERDGVEDSLRTVFPLARVLTADDGCEAVVLLRELLVDCVVAVRAVGQGGWAGTVGHWMRGAGGMGGIPFIVVPAAGHLPAPSALRQAGAPMSAGEVSV